MAPDVGHGAGITHDQPKDAPRPPLTRNMVELVRRFVLVLIVVLVLSNPGTRIDGVGSIEDCALSELRPPSGLEMLSGRTSRDA